MLKLFVLINLLVLGYCSFCASFIQADGSLVSSEKTENKKYPLSQRKWYQTKGEVKPIFVNIGYHQARNGFCYKGGSSTRSLIGQDAETFNLTKFDCQDFNGKGENKTLFFIKTDKKHYLKFAECTKDKRMSSLAYQIAYDYSDIKDRDKKIEAFCKDSKNRNLALYNKKSQAGQSIGIDECKKIASFVYTDISSKTWSAYNCE